MDYKNIYNEAIPADAIRVDGNFDEVYAAAMKSEEFRESTTPDGIKCDCCGETISPDEVAWHSDEENLDTCIDCEEEAGVSFSESKLLPNERIMESGYTTFTNHIGEKDSFYDPYKKEPADVPYEEVFASNNWEARFFKGLDFSTKEGIEKAAKRWESNYFSDLVHDIAHDGDRAGAREASNALMKLQRTIHEKARELGLKSADVEEPLKKMLYRTEQHERRIAAAEKGKETKAINSKIKVQTYIKELRDLDLPAEVRELFAPDGYYKERRSYGVIKNYLDKPYGKALLAVWKDQFAN